MGSALKQANRRKKNSIRVKKSPKKKKSSFFGGKKIVSDKIFDSLTTKSHRDLSVHVPPSSARLRPGFGLACNKLFLS